MFFGSASSYPLTRALMRFIGDARMTTRTLLLCAFILWASWSRPLNVGGIVTHYDAWETYTTLPECLQARKGWKLPQGYTRAVCLPDTVNPNTK